MRCQSVNIMPEMHLNDGMKSWNEMGVLHSGRGVGLQERRMLK